MKHRFVIKTWDEMLEIGKQKDLHYIQLPQNSFNKDMEELLPQSRVISVVEDRGIREVIEFAWTTKERVWYVNKYMIKRKAYKNDL